MGQGFVSSSSGDLWTSLAPQTSGNCSGGSISHQEVYLEEVNTGLGSPLQSLTTENQQLKERMKQLEDQQQMLEKEVKRLKKEVTIGEMEYEGQKAQWEKEKASLQSTVKEKEIQNDKLRERLEYHEILVEEYKQENKRRKLDLRDQEQLINDISKECAKERKERTHKPTFIKNYEGMLTG
ncbi:spindle assembly checkpoint component MAD1-like [Hevea brasiliensis]|uniref:spindle assembly checkpoint component MAD1-like n=1 Tax=Hevea brasiliensis TaxID=3981 RepID=UPI0025CE8426|nr:spindle assembly checkpoint component MAD1-like [Hevea brasiliensis]